MFEKTLLESDYEQVYFMTSLPLFQTEGQARAYTQWPGKIQNFTYSFDL